ncbi:MAG TPA: BrnT family toxin [Rhizomicrobium sp.]|jgi:hypothetical protein
MLPMKIAGFDWDDGNRDKCRKHGVTVQEIEALLRGDPPLSRDVSRSDSEDRFIAVDRTPAGRALFVVFTLRLSAGQLIIRPVSARYMHRKELEAHGKKNIAPQKGAPTKK